MLLVTSPDSGNDLVLRDVSHCRQQADVALRIGVVIAETETGRTAGKPTRPAPCLSVTKVNAFILRYSHVLIGYQQSDQF